MTFLRRLPALGAAWAMLALTTRVAAADAAPVVPPAAADARSATTDSCEGERFVVVTFAPDFEAAFAAEVRTDLATELAQRGLALCSAGASPREPAASVALSIDSEVVLIALDDRLTHKRVARDLSLSALPENGRALATAIAIDELLRASWAELTLQRDNRPAAPEQPAPTPATVDLTVGPHTGRPPAPNGPPSKPRLLIGGDVGYAHTGYRYDAFSLNARVSLRPGWGWLVLTVGPLSTLRKDTPRGDVIARGVAGALTAGGCVQGAPRVFACGGARAGVDFLAFRGSDAQMATPRDQNAVIAHASGVALIGGALTPRLSLFGELGVGSVVRGARITDGTQRLVGVTGLLLSLHVGMEFEL